MKLIINSTVEKQGAKRFEIEGHDYYDCIRKFCIETPSNLAGFVELRAEVLQDESSQMWSEEDLIIQAFEECMKIYNIDHSRN